MVTLKDLNTFALNLLLVISMHFPCPFYFSKQVSKTCYRARWANYGMAVDEELLKELKLRQLGWEAAIANATVKGKLWNSLGSKQDLKDQVEVKVRL